MDSSKVDSQVNVKCLFCRAPVRFEGLPATHYEDHLSTEHNILHDKDKIIIWALQEQAPAQAIDTKPVKTSQDFEAKQSEDLKNNEEPKQPPKLSSFKLEQNSLLDDSNLMDASNSFSTEPRDNEDQAEHSKATMTGMISGTESPSELDSSTTAAVPWYCGLLYTCKVCPRQFFELLELRRHLDNEHNTRYKDAVAEYGNMIAASNIYECLICGRGMPHSFSSIRRHLDKSHGFTVSSYYDQYKEDIDWEPVSLPITDQALLGRKSEPPKTPSPPRRGYWLNKCTYSCKMCKDHSATNYSSFMTHINELHKETARSYAKKFGPKFTSVLVSHTCQLCGNIVDWDRSQISAHLASLHPHVSIQDYVKKYKDTYSDNPILDESQSESWMNGCVFECKKCETPKHFTTRGKLALHLRQEHELNFSEYTHTFGSMFSRFVLHKCLICQKSIRWDRDSILAHLNKQHDTTPEIYAREHLKEQKDKILAMAETKTNPPRRRTGDWLSQCNFSCKQCSYITKFRQSFLRHVSQEHNLSIKDNGEFYTRVVYHFCQLCGSSVIWNRDFITRHLKEKHKSISAIEYRDMFKACYNEDKVFDKSDDNKWLDRCKLVCKECNERPKFESKKTLTVHLLKVHSMPIKKYQDKHSTIYSSYDFYTCKVCDKSIRWEAESITYHLSRIHKMTPERYVSEVLNGDLETHLKDLDQVIQVSKAGKTSSDWLNRSTYKCRSCTFETSISKTFVRHLSKSHDMTTKDFCTLNGGKLFSSTVNHTCQLCGLTMPWTNLVIVKHLYNMHHSVSHKDYVERFMNSYTDNPELQETDEDKWMNQCNFKCKECSRPSLFSTRSKLALHLSKDHKTTLQEYIAKNKSIISTLINHTCKICDKAVRWDRDSITAHLDKNHSMTPKQYFEEHVKDNLEETLSAMKVLKPEAKTIAKAGTNLKWSDKCKFVCHICYKVVGSKNILKSHLSSEHKMTANLQDRCPSKVLSKVTHGCLICGQELLFDSAVLKKHLESFHGRMSDHSYKSEHYDKYNFEAVEGTDWTVKSRYGCKVCFKIFAGKERLRDHMLSQHQKTNQERGTGIIEEHFLICLVEDKQQKICSKKVIWDSSEITNHLSTHNMTPEEYHSSYMKDSTLDKIVESEKENWMNKCSFLCKICGKMFSTRTALSEHAKENHSNRLGEEKTVNDNVVNMVLHSCQICSVNILWEEESLFKHLSEKHDTMLSEYFSSSMSKYSSNEENRRKVQEFESWTNKSAYSCIICPDNPVMTKKTSLNDHMNKKHPDCASDDLIKFKEEAFAKKQSHICQVCGVSILWDIRNLQGHIEKSHYMKLPIYRAMYMSDYTEDLNAIEHRRKEHQRQVGSSLPELMEVSNDGNNSNLMSQETSLLEITCLEDDDDLGMTKEVQKWAQGCLYSCAICKIDIAGARPFKSHLANEHDTTLSAYKQVQGVKQVCIATTFHFCRLCCSNVRHDELDLKLHFEKDHMTTVSNYFEMFRGKLKAPKLVRPESNKVNTANNSNTNTSASKPNSSSELKRKRPTDANIDAKKNKTL